MAQHVADEMDHAALPRAGQHARDRRLEALVFVGDCQADTGEPAQGRSPSSGRLQKASTCSSSARQSVETRSLAIPPWCLLRQLGLVL